MPPGPSVETLGYDRSSLRDGERFEHEFACSSSQSEMLQETKMRPAGRRSLLRARGNLSRFTLAGLFTFDRLFFFVPPKRRQNSNPIALCENRECHSSSLVP